MSGLSAGAFIIGAFNALAFTGTSFLFRSIDKSGYQDELKRHNRAMENLAAAKEKWYENQVKRKDKILKLRHDMVEAGADISATNKALIEVQKITHNGLVFTQEPKVSDFYEPSDEMKDLQYVASGVAGLGLGAIGATLIPW